MILDTSIVLERCEQDDQIDENVAIVSAVEFPPVTDYEGFTGLVYTLLPEDQVLAIQIQKKLRSEGNATPAPDLLIAAIAINRDEKLLTKDEDFEEIEEVSELEVEFAEE